MNKGKLHQHLVFPVQQTDTQSVHGPGASLAILVLWPTGA